LKIAEEIETVKHSDISSLEMSHLSNSALGKGFTAVVAAN
jgi:hypothetical protein